MLTVNSLLGQSSIDEAADVLDQPDAKLFFFTLLARLQTVQEDRGEIWNPAPGIDCRRSALEDSTHMPTKLLNRNSSFAGDHRLMALYLVAM